MKKNIKIIVLAVAGLFFTQEAFAMRQERIEGNTEWPNHIRTLRDARARCLAKWFHLKNIGPEDFKKLAKNAYYAGEESLNELYHAVTLSGLESGQLLQVPVQQTMGCCSAILSLATRCISTTVACCKHSGAACFKCCKYSVPMCTKAGVVCCRAVVKTAPGCAIAGVSCCETGAVRAAGLVCGSARIAVEGCRCCSRGVSTMAKCVAEHPEIVCTCCVAGAAGYGAHVYQAAIVAALTGR